MAILGGTSWRPGQDFLLEQFAKPEVKQLKLHRLPRGMDNARIDVLLAPALEQAIKDMVQAHLLRHMKGLQGADDSLRDLQDAAARFEQIHSAITLSVAQLSRSRQSREHSQCYQLAVIKAIFMHIDAAVQSQRNGSEHENNAFARSEAGALAGAGTTSAQSWSALRYSVAHDLMRILHRVEGGSLRKLRKSVLGISWPVTENMLFSPLMELGDLESEQSFLENYPLCWRKADNLKHCNTILMQHLAEWLPEYLGFSPVQLQAADFKSLPTRRDKGEFSGFLKVEEILRAFMSPVEYKEGAHCWMDVPENLLLMLGGDKEPWPANGVWHHSSLGQFQKNLLTQIDKALRHAGLGDELYASLAMPELCKRLRLGTALGAAYQYLSGKLTKRAIQQHLLNTKTIINQAQTLEHLESARKEVRGMSGQPHLLAGLLYDFARLRRDLKLTWDLYQNLDMIRLMEREEDILLSRSNGLLHEFSTGQCGNYADAPVSGHVIIKADLRGSTALTSSMIAQGLNPAAYFSQNLFDPINRLLDRFGAEKVFVEGDAVILMLLEHEGFQKDALVVARACGLAYHMLEVVKQRNAKNRHLKLPHLELGIGIAYVNEAPNYLFDEGHKITISAAINRADRLSSCSAGLHSAKLGSGKNGWGVEVVLPQTEESRSKQINPQEVLRRYNVNGIELDLPAFSRLSEELVLRKVKSTSLGGRSGSRYHVGRFPDSYGHTEWLLVREAPVRVWDGQKCLDEGDVAMRFFEVVSDSRMIEKLRVKLPAAEKGEPDNPEQASA